MTGRPSVSRARHTPFRRRRAHGICALVLGAFVAVVFAAPASADYTVWSCRGPDGAPVSASAWQSAGTPIDDFADGCAQGGPAGALTVTIPTGRSGTLFDDGGFRFQTTGANRITSYRLWRSVVANGQHNPAGGFYASILENDFGSSGSPVAGCYNGQGCTAIGDPADPLGEANLVLRDEVSLGSVSIAAGCQATSTGSCPDTQDRSGLNAQFRLYRAEFTIADRAAPTLNGDVVGLPASGGTMTGAVTLAVPVADAGAGVQSTTVSLDGKVVASARVADCVEPYTRSGPCPDRTGLGLVVDTTQVPDGPHELTIGASDGAGNTATLLSQPVTVDNASHAPPVPPPVDPPVEPPASPPDAAPIVIVPPAVIISPPVAKAGDYVIDLDRQGRVGTKPRKVSGRVVTSDGAAVPGAVLALEWRPFGTFSDAWTTARTVTADASGRFAVATGSAPRQERLRLIPVGPSSATFASDAFSVYGGLRLDATRSSGTVRNGRTLTVTGRLTGAGVSAEGKEVLVQAIVGGRWQALDRLRASATGRVQWAYRFQRTTATARYSFRLLAVKDSKRWPWSTVASKTVRVLVLP